MKLSSDDIKTDYSNYTVEDLLLDDFFVRSMISPTKFSDQFWQSQIENGILDATVYESAGLFIETVQSPRERMDSVEITEFWSLLESSNKKSRKKHQRFFAITSVAVCFIMVLAGFFYFYQYQKSDQASTGIENVKKPDILTSDVSLVLTDQKSVSFQGADVEIRYDSDGVKVNNEKLVIEESEVKGKSSRMDYNQILVPAGRRTTLSLPDGTKVWLNAGSRVVYPVEFSPEKREIYVDGEAYLDVARNPNKPFVVKTSQINVTVYGTEFNVNAYENSSEQNVVLVSGSIVVTGKNKEKINLQPSQMYTFSEEGDLSVRQVDVDDYILWCKGLYQYKSESLGVILKRLALYYGEDIVFDSSVSVLKCTGKLNMRDNLKTVIDGIAKTVPIQCDYVDGKYHILIK